MYDTDKRKLVSALCHGAIFFTSLVFPVLIPIAILLVSEDPAVKDNAKEAINFQLNVLLYGAIIAFMAATIILLPLAWILGPLLFIFHWVLPVFAILDVLGNPEKPYRYPFIFRLL
ncbi:MAG TPA: DUF4870 domain-containing protein [Cyanobacteria bacterium UBA11369]|nr:DUF4870 domain-containing protein [Cyanobacteria bacterium UBA11371]HBE33949.1 DUF4870 domain-containing protein [Cyanobacteria bacterium UBA11368]HBE53363.1 DUF4870 domain-containing protein [Cyanobacteria bacterium UBA11369]